MKKFKLIIPSEHNGYSLFPSELEDNPTILFHGTSAKKFDSILKIGFKSAFYLGTGDLKSVSYAKESSSCLNHISIGLDQQSVVFAVEFSTLNQPYIRNNPSDIHVFRDLQPKILGYVLIPKNFTYY